jgi:thiol-disulfide isomerase/thioredoxin
MRLKQTILVISAAVLLLFVLAFRRPGQDAAPAPPAQQGVLQQGPVSIRLIAHPDPAPSFTLSDVAGQPLSLTDFRGKAVLLTFWATWCGPCRAEVPDLIALQERYKDRLEIIALTVDDGSEESVRQFVKKRGINYRVAVAPDDLQDKFGGVHGLPTVFILDTSGRMVQKHVGLRDPTLYDLEIRALLGLPVEARVETIEDTGQIFLANARRATEFPGLDLSQLTPEQRKVVIRRLNEESCDCGCGMTLAQCRINDAKCGVSLAKAKRVLQAASARKPEGIAAPTPR